MVSSSFTILSRLLLIFILLHSQQSGAAFSVDEVLPQFGLPRGLFPNSVKNYTFSPEDGSLVVELDEQPCYVKLDKYLISYDERITGTLRLGSITNLKGIQMKRVLLWVDVDEIKVDLPPHDLVYFQVGLTNKKLDVDLFQTIPSCSSRKKRITKLPPSVRELPMLLME